MIVVACPFLLQLLKKKNEILAGFRANVSHTQAVTRCLGHSITQQLICWFIVFGLGHEDRVLSVILSPDGSTIASVAGDETIRLWKSFELDPVKKKAKEKLTKSTSSGMHQSIR